MTVYDFAMRDYTDCNTHFTHVIHEIINKGSFIFWL